MRFDIGDEKLDQYPYKLLFMIIDSSVANE